MIASPSLSANRYAELMKWGVDDFERRVEMYLKAAMQDDYLPLTEPPSGELEEMDMLAQQEQMMRMILAQPPDVKHEAIRSQAQQKMARLIELRLKHHAANG